MEINLDIAHAYKSEKTISSKKTIVFKKEMEHNLDIAHAYKSEKTVSSKKTIVFKKVMENNFQENLKGKYILNKKKKRNKKKKLKKIQELQIIPYDAVDDDSKGKNLTPTYYYTFYDDELSALFAEKKNRMINLYNSGLRLVDTVDGAIMTNHGGHAVFILVKRSDALRHNNNGRADSESLQWLMKHHNNVNIRGSAKSGFSEKYVTIGAHGSHFKQGIHIKKLSGKNKEFHEPYLKKWFGRIKLIASEYMQFGLLSSLAISKFIVDDNITYDYNKGKQNNDDIPESNWDKMPKSIWASMASSYNYISPAHTDDDSFLSCLTTTLYPNNEPRNGSYQYPFDSKICCYFCLPGVNTMIALRPGDVLFFNPLQKHCLSQRTIDYLDEKLYCSAFYLTTKQVSGNNNTKPYNFDEKISQISNLARK